MEHPTPPPEGDAAEQADPVDLPIPEPPAPVAAATPGRYEWIQVALLLLLGVAILFGVCMAVEYMKVEARYWQPPRPRPPVRSAPGASSRRPGGDPSRARGTQRGFGGGRI